MRIALARTLPVAALLFAASACSTTPRPLVNSDPTADFGSYESFGFIQSPATDRGEYESLVTSFLKTAIAQELDIKGLHYADDPDLVDAQTSTLVWEGSVAGRITDEVIANLEKSIDDGVRIILSEYPEIAGGN